MGCTLEKKEYKGMNILEGNNSRWQYDIIFLTKDLIRVCLACEDKNLCWKKEEFVKYLDQGF